MPGFSLVATVIFTVVVALVLGFAIVYELAKRYHGGGS